MASWRGNCLPSVLSPFVPPRRENIQSRFKTVLCIHSVHTCRFSRPGFAAFIADEVLFILQCDDGC